MSKLAAVEDPHVQKGQSMKFDWDLAREILLKLEGHPDANGYNNINIHMPNRPEETVHYHVMLLHEAGLIEGLDNSSSSGIYWLPRRLTFAGHEFLGTYRQDASWNKTKAFVIEKTGSLSFEALKMAGAVLMKSALGG